MRTPRAGGYGDPVYTWAFQSSQPRGGQIITYETRLEEDGVIRCNCPGWIFCKGEPAVKTCKHKFRVQDEAPQILTAYRRGDTLPVFDSPLPTPRRMIRAETAQPVAVPTNNGSSLRRGRVIVMD